MSEPAVLERTRLDFEYIGPAAQSAKGWVVTDESQQVVATVPQETGLRFGIAPPPQYPLLDAAGQRVALVAAEQERHAHQILDAGGREVAHVGHYDGDRDRTELELTDGASTLARIAVTTTSTSITGFTVTDASGQPVATIEQRSERISFLKGRTWFALQRPADLTDPLGLVAVTAPLLVHADLELRELRSNTGRSKRKWRPL